MTGEQISAIRGARIAGPGAELLFDDVPVDIHLDGGVIADIAPTGALPLTGEVIDADGCWVVPGLWDEHVHSVQWALASERVDLTATGSAAEAAAVTGRAAPLDDGRRIGAGYRDALWADSPQLELLDRATGTVPTYLINADVHSVWLNSAALHREGFTTPDGVLREADAFEVSRRLNDVAPERGDAAVSAAGARAAARGATGIVDFDMAWNAEAWSRRVDGGFRSQRVEFAIYPDHLDRALAEGLRTGAQADDAGLVHVGRVKIIADGSLGTRTAACAHPYPDGGHGALNVSAEELVELLVRAAGGGLEAAVHAIGDRAATMALDAFTAAETVGTIEHAQLVRHADIARMARLGIIASVQPQHEVDDRDLAAALWGAQTSLAYPLVSLVRAGVDVRFGSDAPVAPLDPWQAIAAAVDRGDESLTVVQALEASTRTRVHPGDAADLVVCGADPLTADAATLRTMPVHATVLGGRLTFRA